MSLRARLALSDIMIVGGILLLYGLAIYTAVSYTLNKQIYELLKQTAELVTAKVEINIYGQLSVEELADLDLTTDVYIQIWDRAGRMVSPPINLPSTFRLPLDSVNLKASIPTYRDIEIGNSHLRVLTVPLTVAGSNRVIGTLQLATSLEVLQVTLQTLLFVLVIGSMLAMVTAGIISWASTRQALKPLQTVTQTAMQITRADDLSQRIPYNGPDNDEIGQLIQAFNQTLGRLENLFNSQRRFLTDVGHELRTPLTVIKGNIDLMRRMNCTDEESMESIENEVDRLTRMVGDLLILAQAETGNLPLDMRQIELDNLLFEVIGQMSVLSGDRLKLRIDEIDQVLVCGDQDRLKQVLVNLIGNAIKYTPEGGEVIIGLSKTDEKARLMISDTGPGIPPEDMPYIFERFYRGEKSRTRSKDGKGFGLGLSIAYWIITNHDGSIEVMPREPHGTTFCVWLPLAKQPCTNGQAGRNL